MLHKIKSNSPNQKTKSKRTKPVLILGSENWILRKMVRRERIENEYLKRIKVFSKINKIDWEMKLQKIIKCGINHWHNCPETVQMVWACSKDEWIESIWQTKLQKERINELLDKGLTGIMQKWRLLKISGQNYYLYQK